MNRVLKNRKANSASPAASVSAVDASPTPAAPPKFTPRGANKNRIMIAVKDGAIDFSAMSPEAAKLLNELLHAPEVQAQFGIGPLREHFDPQHCKRIYEAVGIVLAGVGKFAISVQSVNDFNDLPTLQNSFLFHHFLRSDVLL